MRALFFVTTTALVLAGCSKQDATNASVASNMVAADNRVNALAHTAAPAPEAAPAVAGFDPAKVPVVTPTLGGFPYFGLLEGYTAATKADVDSWVGGNLRDANFDRYEFFDGVKLIPVEGRLRTVQARGQGRSFIEVMRNYQKLVGDLGGVTVFEGTGQKLLDAKLNYADARHRNRYTMAANEQQGVYMLRTPTSEIWVEVYQMYGDRADNYWITVVEKKALDVSAKLMPAEAMKKALDANGRVALNVNFDTDKTVVKPDSQPLLAEVVKLLNGDPKLRLSIEGHTDNAGTPPHNQSLSQGRAQAVMATLIASGIDAARLSAKGFGQTKPVADNANEEGRAKNRRVELVKL